MNKCFFIGRIVTEPELRETGNGEHKVANIRIAVDRSRTRGDDKQSDFFTCTIWDRAAETICKYCSKGDKISLVGRMENRSYEDDNGSKHIITELKVEDFEFIGGKNSISSSNQQSSNAVIDDDDDDDDELPV